MSTTLLHYTSRLPPEEFLAKCDELPYWYHSFYFDNGVAKRGIYDIGRDLDVYGFPMDMRGMRVLDVGPAGGWFSALFCQRGAEVTAVDVRGFCDYDHFGSYMDLPIEKEKPAPDMILDGRPVYASPAGASFWLMRDLLGLKINYVNSRVYDLDLGMFEGRPFDLVFVGAVLMHLRDPIQALRAVRRVCCGRVIATIYCDPNLQPVEPAMALRNWTTILWWVPNKLCVERWFEAAGFEKPTLRHGVRLSIDQPFVDENGESFGKEQILWRAEALV